MIVSVCLVLNSVFDLQMITVNNSINKSHCSFDPSNALFLSVSLFWPSVCPYCAAHCFRPAVDFAVGLPIGVIIACGLALLLLAAFVSWKLCWVPWRNKALSSSSAALAPDDCPSFHLPSLLPSPQPSEVTMATEKEKYSMASMGLLEAAVKISHTSPDIPAEVQLSMREHFVRRTQRMQRQTTEPASSTR